ncbi:MAG: cysteine rich repeat-containing protein [Hyphomicrobiaceae bacterium]
MIRQFAIHLFTFGLTIIAMPFFSAELVGAADSTTLIKDCESEIRTYCPTVTPGDDRLVACLIAFEDKATPRCRLTAYLESGSLNKRLKELQALARTCSSDILQYCSKVEAGGGRIYDCLKANKSTLTDNCRATINSAPKI